MPIHGKITNSDTSGQKPIVLVSAFAGGIKKPFSSASIWFFVSMYIYLYSFESSPPTDAAAAAESRGTHLSKKIPKMFLKCLLSVRHGRLSVVLSLHRLETSENLGITSFRSGI